MLISICWRINDTFSLLIFCMPKKIHNKVVLSRQVVPCPECKMQTSLKFSSLSFCLLHVSASSIQFLSNLFPLSHWSCCMLTLAVWSPCSPYRCCAYVYHKYMCRTWMLLAAVFPIFVMVPHGFGATFILCTIRGTQKLIKERNRGGPVFVYHKGMSHIKIKN
jgi:hypothetical protein